MSLRVGLISLGCPRNLVDSEIILGLLENKDYRISENIQDADVAIVNTCSFIKEAKEESIDTILELVDLKKEGQLKKVIVYGCLPQRYGGRLSCQLKGVDAFVGTSPLACNQQRPSRLRLTPRHYAYVKISEGCDNNCSYCVIPKVRGRLRSRAIPSILEEVRCLQESGELREINLIGQDTTLYGSDIYGQRKLAELIKELAGMFKENCWIRILYGHPAHIPEDVMEVMKDTPKVCKYLDLPLQHINDRILNRMGRNITKSQIVHLIERLRKNIPNLVIRTSFIVGFPGEGDKEFRELVDFIYETRFERLGVFTYSREEGTKAYSFSGQVPEKVKQNRLDEIMTIQQEISRRRNESLLGKEVDVLIDEQETGDNHLFLARTQDDAPEVDGVVFVKARKAKPGDFIRAKIVDTYEYDLVGEKL